MKTPTRQLRHRTFNMIEVVLALVVVAIGMLSIIGLIPIGTQATRDAIGESMSADMADNLLNQLAYRVRENWDGTVGSSAKIPDAGDIPDISGAVHPLWEQDWTSLANPSAEITQDLVATGQIDGNIFYSDTYTGERVYRIYETRKVTRDTGIVTGVAVKTIPEFDAIVRIWKEPVSIDYYDGAWKSSNLGTASRAYRLYIEMSWPSSVDYASRTKSYYSTEVAR